MVEKFKTFKIHLFSMYKRKIIHNYISDEEVLHRHGKKEKAEQAKEWSCQTLQKVEDRLGSNFLDNNV